MYKGFKTILAIGAIGAVSIFVYNKYKMWKIKDQIITVDQIQGILDAEGREPVEPIEEFEEEVKELRRGVDVNSHYALEQFISMETAEIKQTSKEGLVLQMLYGHMFEPINGGDKTLKGVLEDNREQFFGPDSQWTSAVTWSDVIMHYARKIDYNVGEGIPHWVRFIIEQLEITKETNLNDLNDIFDCLIDHSFVNQSTGYYGLFGLDDDGVLFMGDSIESAMDNKVTFQIEFGAFLEMLMKA